MTTSGIASCVWDRRRRDEAERLADVVWLADGKVLEHVELGVFDDGARRHRLAGAVATPAGIAPEQLQKVPRRVAAAGGPRKHTAIRAALLGGWVDVLITDVGEARRLLDDREP